MPLFLSPLQATVGCRITDHVRQIPPPPRQQECHEALPSRTPPPRPPPPPSPCLLSPLIFSIALLGPRPAWWLSAPLSTTRRLQHGTTGGTLLARREEGRTAEELRDPIT